MCTRLWRTVRLKHTHIYTQTPTEICETVSTAIASECAVCDSTRHDTAASSSGAQGALWRTSHTKCIFVSQPLAAARPFRIYVLQKSRRSRELGCVRACACVRCERVCDVSEFVFLASHIKARVHKYAYSHF